MVLSADMKCNTIRVDNNSTNLLSIYKNKNTENPTFKQEINDSFVIKRDLVADLQYKE